MKIKKLAIVDGSYFLHRSLKVPEIYELMFNGVRTGGIFQFLRLLCYELKDQGGLPLVVFDGGLSPKRLEVYPNYKRSEDKLEDAKKFENNELTKEQKKIYEEGMEYLETYRYSRKVIIDILNKLGVPVVIMNQVEGDDIIAVASRMKEVGESVILTDDKDLIQLATPTTKIYRPMRKEEWTYDRLVEEFISPDHYMFIKAVVGDGSDNIPQVCKGVGGAKAKILADIYYSPNGGFEGIAKYLEDNKRYKWVQNLLNTDYVNNITRNLELVNLLGNIYDSDNIKRNILELISNSLEVNCKDVDIIMTLAQLAITEVDVHELIRIIKMSRYNVQNN